MEEPLKKRFKTVHIDVNFADKLVVLVKTHYAKLSAKGKPKAQEEWTVLSAFIQEMPNGDCFVVSLGTGTKCLGRSELALDGTLVHDSHAEVIARRGFIRYLMDECSKKDSKTVDIEKRGFRMGIRFHFVTSAVPCGDAAIFPLQTPGPEDIHRTGAKCVDKEDPKQPGKNYHVVGATRRKPGRGDPTASLSCSDKLARWIAVGVQGALLSLKLGKVVLSSLVVAGGTGFHLESMERALLNRLIGDFDRPSIVQARETMKEVQPDGLRVRPAPSSIAWWYSFKSKNNSHEALVNGRLLGAVKSASSVKAASALCKRSLFKLFLSMSEKSKECSYVECKSNAVEYQKHWTIVKTSCFNDVWTDKPLIDFKIKDND